MPFYINSELIEDEDFAITAEHDRRWYPVYCHSNREKKLVEYAVNYKITCYLPTIDRHRITRGKRIVTPVPMFTGYVFLCLARQQNWQVKTSGLVAGILNVTEETEHLLINDLNKVRIFEKLSRSQEVEVRKDICAGKKVRITQGKLKGLEGVVLKRKDRTMVIVELEFLGCCLSTVEVHDLELITD